MCIPKFRVSFPLGSNSSSSSCVKSNEFQTKDDDMERARDSECTCERALCAMYTCFGNNGKVSVYFDLFRNM